MNRTLWVLSRHRTAATGFLVLLLVCAGCGGDEAPVKGENAAVQSPSVMHDIPPIADS